MENQNEARQLYIENNAIKIVNLCSKIYHFDSIYNEDKYSWINSLGRTFGLDLRDYFIEKNYDVYSQNCIIINDKESAMEAIADGHKITQADLDEHGYDFIYDLDETAVYSEEQYRETYIDLSYNVDDWIDFNFSDYVKAINSELEPIKKIVADFYEKKSSMLAKYGIKQNEICKIGDQFFESVKWQDFSFHIKIDNCDSTQIEIFEPQNFTERFSKKTDVEKKEIWDCAEKILGWKIAPGLLQIFIDGRENLEFWIEEQKSNKKMLQENIYYHENFA